MFTYLIICPLLFLAGFVDAIGGGGGLISLPAYMFAGLPAHTAIATNKMSSSMGTSISTWHFFQQGYIRPQVCIPSIVTALIGSWLGAHLSLFLSENILKILMLAALPFIAFYVLKSKNLDSWKHLGFPLGKTIFLCCIVSLIIGAYDGLYGPGTGTFLLLLFTGLCHLSLQDAAGTTKVINLTTNLCSLVVFLANGKVLFPLGIIAGICNMAGNYLGSRCFSKKGGKFVKPVILTVLIIFFLKVSIEFIM